MASSRDLHCHSQKPAINSFVSENGPSMTVLLFPGPNFTRTPLDDGCSPSPASITPAFTSSSLNLVMSVRLFSSGRTPDSESLFAFTTTMNRISVSPLVSVGAAVCSSFNPRRLYQGDERRLSKSTAVPVLFVTRTTCCGIGTCSGRREAGRLRGEAGGRDAQ